MGSIQMSIKECAAKALTTRDEIGAIASGLQLPANVPAQCRVAWALMRLSFDHATAIIDLFLDHGRELAGSSYALLRPMNEVFKRGTWFAFCATEDETQDFIENDRVPSRNLAAEIEEHPPFNQYPMFTNVFENNWTQFHSFTHGGMHVVDAYTAGGEIGAAFSDAEIRSVIDHAESIAFNVVHVMCMVVSRFDLDAAKPALARLEEIAKRLRESRHQPPEA